MTCPQFDAPDLLSLLDRGVQTRLEQEGVGGGPSFWLGRSIALWRRFCYFWSLTRGGDTLEGFTEALFNASDLFRSATDASIPAAARNTLSEYLSHLPGCPAFPPPRKGGWTLAEIDPEGKLSDSLHKQHGYLSMMLYRSVVPLEAFLKHKDILEQAGLFPADIADIPENFAPTIACALEWAEIEGAMPQGVESQFKSL